MTLALVVSSLCVAAADAGVELHDVRVTVLSSMIVDYIGDNEARGEWGFAALVEADGKALLFDTGAHPETVLNNARAMGVDLSRAQDVVLSHFHGDHTSGLVALRKALRSKNPHALERAHVGAAFFWPRREGAAVLRDVETMRREYVGLGGRFIEHPNAEQLVPGVWVSGAVPRVTDEHNFPPGLEVLRPDAGWSVDDVPDDLALVLDTTRGLIVVSGCGHAGIVNTVRVAKERVRAAPIEVLIGGFHLFNAPDDRVEWTAHQLATLGVRQIVGAHCTGVEALIRLRTGAGLTRQTAVQAAVGTVYSLDGGINAGPLGLTR